MKADMAVTKMDVAVMKVVVDMAVAEVEAVEEGVVVSAGVEGVATEEGRCIRNPVDIMNMLVMALLLPRDVGVDVAGEGVEAAGEATSDLNLDPMGQSRLLLDVL
ncbi:hypothetical protein QJS04_geneDACA001793 [Acorus gramineus]|uniref:Uncharacterized protein n=1 Tax=Acorus gramineus TaxID=55184 RepID=A0AAV9BEP8_ACOGR|nr:hypothetical protein QJS04_geneDACA001793 [Acorus gramineus]